MGLIQHGLELVVITDYFRLGSLRSAYREVARKICAYDEYRSWMVDTLLRRKVCHWDARVRDEASLLLSAVAPMCTDMLGKALVKLREGCVSAEPETRHGALLAMGRIAKALVLCAGNALAASGIKQGDKDQGSSSMDSAAKAVDLHDVTSVVPELEAARLFRGKGGEMVRVAACVLTQCLAEARIPLTLNAARIKPHLAAGRPDSGKTSTKRHKEFLDECLRNTSIALQEAAAAALTPFCAAYLCSLDVAVRSAVVTSYAALFEAKDALPSYTRGAALALGALPPAMYADSASFAKALAALCSAIESSPDAATRKYSVRGLAGVLVTKGAPLASELATRCTRGVLCALRDYATDERGDVGSWTREAACLQFPHFLACLPWDVEGADALASALLEIMSGRLDRLRGPAQGEFTSFVRAFSFPFALPNA